MRISLQPNKARACARNRERHEHGVLGSVGALVVAQLVGAPEGVLLLRAVVLHAQLAGGVSRGRPQHQEAAVARRPPSQPPSAPAGCPAAAAAATLII